MIDSICFFYLFVFWNILYNFYYSSSSIVIELIKPTKLVFLLKYKEEFVLDWTIWAATIESNSKITIGRLKFTNTLMARGGAAYIWEGAYAPPDLWIFIPTFLLKIILAHPNILTLHICCCGATFLLSLAHFIILFNLFKSFHLLFFSLIKSI
jgi:hypothetical protein